MFNLDLDIVSYSRTQWLLFHVPMRRAVFIYGIKFDVDQKLNKREYFATGPIRYTSWTTRVEGSNSTELIFTYLSNPQI